MSSLVQITVLKSTAEKLSRWHHQHRRLDSMINEYLER